MIRLCCLAFVLLLALPGHAQVPVTANPDHEGMLRHPDPKLSANKRLVYDFWREVFEGAHMDLAPKYLAEDYIQHNPRELAETADPSKEYTTTWFDMFRIANGRIAEHWDPATRP